jgi:hypothetical protein
MTFQTMSHSPVSKVGSTLLLSYFYCDLLVCSFGERRSIARLVYGYSISVSHWLKLHCAVTEQGNQGSLCSLILLLDAPSRLACSPKRVRSTNSIALRSLSFQKHATTICHPTTSLSPLTIAATPLAKYSAADALVSVTTSAATSSAATIPFTLLSVRL